MFGVLQASTNKGDIPPGSFLYDALCDGIFEAMAFLNARASE